MPSRPRDAGAGGPTGRCRGPGASPRAGPGPRTSSLEAGLVHVDPARRSPCRRPSRSGVLGEQQATCRRGTSRAAQRELLERVGAVGRGRVADRGRTPRAPASSSCVETPDRDAQRAARHAVAHAGRRSMARDRPRRGRRSAARRRACRGSTSRRAGPRRIRRRRRRARGRGRRAAAGVRPGDELERRGVPARGLERAEDRVARSREVGDRRRPRCPGSSQPWRARAASRMPRGFWPPRKIGGPPGVSGAGGVGRAAERVERIRRG